MTDFARILLVEDSTDARMTLATILRDAGHTVETAADGLKALAKLDDFRPDIILTDLRMPGLDGVGLIKQAHERDASIIVVLMTADASLERAVSAMRHGAADYLLKPIDIDHLHLVVQRELERHRLRSETKHLKNRLTVQQLGLEAIIGSAHSASQRVLFDVQDSCGGLPAGAAATLFQPFVQRGEDRSGVGLGLAICRKAAKANGGEIRVRDIPGQGCVFTLDLPQTA